MSPVRTQLNSVIDCLPESEQLLLLEIARRFIVDDIATQDDIATHIEAVAAHERGETIDFYDIDWDNFDNTDSV